MTPIDGSMEDVSVSSHLLYAVLAVPALVAGVYLLVLLAADPVAVYIVVFLGIATMATKTLLGDDGSRSPGRANCPDCGAPIPADADSCGYCESSLEGPGGR